MPLGFGQLFNRFVLGVAPSSLDRLTNDILVDQIFSYLSVEDVLCIRMVSRLYYNLTHHPIIWKRLLRCADIPLPPLPPTARHSYPKLTGLEAERLLTRALSVQKNWMQREPEPFSIWSFNAHHVVLAMTLLPGGHHLVASVADRQRYHHSLVVFVMDEDGSARAVVKTPTHTKAYHLQAKYMTIRGVRGIAIAYVRRDYLIKADVAKGINITEYSDFHDIDPQVPLKYECVAVHLSLTDIETLDEIYLTEGSTRFVEEARKYPPPFRNLLRISSRSPLEHISLEEAFGVPYLAVVKHPHRIMFKNLTGGKVSILMCPTYAPFHHRAHTIKAIRIIPYMNRILAVREVDAERTAFNRDPIYVVEMYDIIPSGPVQTEQLVQPVDRGKISMNGVWTHIYISDPGVPPSGDDSILPRLRKKTTEPPKPLPISVFAIRTRDDGIVRLTLYPERVVHQLPPTPPSHPSHPTGAVSRRRVTYRYVLDPLRNSFVTEYEAPLNAEYRVLPGARRPLLYAVPWDDIRSAPRVESMHVLRDEEMLPDSERPAGWRGFKAVEWLYGRLGAPPPEFEAEAFAWDDTIGRLCIALASSMKVQVYDFARAPRIDANGQRMPVPLLLHPNPDRVIPHDECSNAHDAMDCA